MELKKEISNRGLRQDWIAHKAGITPAYLSMLLNKKRSFKKNPLLKNKIYKIVTDRFYGEKTL